MTNLFGFFAVESCALAALVRSDVSTSLRPGSRAPHPSHRLMRLRLIRLTTSILNDLTVDGLQLKMQP
jgi:hypothetical protein